MNHETAPVIFSRSLSPSSGVALGVCGLYGGGVHNSEALTSHICGTCHAVTNDRGVSLSLSFFFFQKLPFFFFPFTFPSCLVTQELTAQDFKINDLDASLFLFIHSCVPKYESVALVLWQEMGCYHGVGQQRRKWMLQWSIWQQRKNTDTETGLQFWDVYLTALALPTAELRTWPLLEKANISAGRQLFTRPTAAIFTKTS